MNLQSFFLSLIDSLIPPDADDPSSPTNIRARVLQVLLLGTALVGLVFYILAIRVEIASQNWTTVLLYTIVYLLLLVITFSRPVPYPAKISTLAAFLYLFGVYSLARGGLFSDGRLWLLAFLSLTAVFLGLRVGLGAGLLNAVTVLTVGWLLNQNILPVQPDILEPFSTWLRGSIIFLVINLFLAGVLGILLSRLTENLDRTRSSSRQMELEQENLRQKAAQLERRQVQLRTAAEISQAIGSELDPDTIFEQTVRLLTERFDLYYAGVFVLDQRGQYALLRAGSGEAGRSMLREGHRLIAGGNSMIGQAIDTRQPRIASDVGAEAVRFDNPYLPETRSELALPMISRGRVRGALTIQSTAEDAFDAEDIAILQTIADSLATALENAELFQQSQSTLTEISTLHRQYLGQAWEQIARQRDQLETVFENPALPAPDESLSTVEMPLTLRGQIIGQVVLETNNPHLTDEEMAVLRAITTQAALALENARLIEETQKRSRRERVVTDITARVQRAVRVDEALQITLRELGQALGAARGTIQLEIKE